MIVCLGLYDFISYIYKKNHHFTCIKRIVFFVDRILHRNDSSYMLPSFTYEVISILLLITEHV